MVKPFKAKPWEAAPGVSTLAVLAAFFVLALAPALISSEASRLRADREQEAVAEATRVAAQVAGALRFSAEEASRFLNAAAARIREVGPDAFCDAIGDLLGPPTLSLFVDVSLVALDDGVLCLAGTREVSFLESVPSWMSGLGADEVRQGDVFFGEVAGEWLMGWGRGISRPEGAYGVVLYVGLAELAKLIEPTLTNPAALITVQGRDGVVLARNLDADVLVGRILPANLRNDRSAVALDMQGVERIWSSAEVPGAGWSVSVGLEASALEVTAQSTVTRLLRMWALWIPLVIAPPLLLAWVASAVKNLRTGVAEAATRGADAVPVTGPREVRDLGRAFREAFARERVQAEKVVRAHEALEERVAIRSRELREKARALEDSNRQLVAALGARDGFVRLISHELRTPITSIVLQGEALLAGVYGKLEPRQEKAAQRISEGGAQLRGIVEEILDIATLESGHATIQREAVSLNRVAREALVACSKAFDAKRQRVDVDLGGDWRPRIDGARVRRALEHLLMNASKFTPSDGRLGIRVLDQPGAGATVVVEVWDEGMGIPSSRLRRIFEPFSQEDSGLDREEGGVGLGLPFVRLVAELHGGYIDVSSVVGEGSTFTLHLPLEPVTADRDQG